MRFKVVVCSGCGRARGVRSDSKRVSCNKCGAIINVKEAKTYFKTDSERELARGVADVNADLQQKGKTRKIGGTRKKGTKATSRPRGKDKGRGKGRGKVKVRSKSKRAIYKETILTLSNRKGTFSFDDVLEMVSKAQLVPISKIDEADITRVLDELKEKGLIFEPRSGVYRRI